MVKNYVLITMCQKLFDRGPTARDSLIQKPLSGRKLRQTASHSRIMFLEGSWCSNTAGTFKHTAVLLSI